MLHPPASRSRRYLAFWTHLLVAALLLGLSAVCPALAKDPSTLPALKRVEAKTQAVAAKVMAATVGIINQSLAGGGRMGEGSGVVVSEEGLVLTAGHVMGQPGAELTVIFPDGRRAAAKALGANFSRDSGLVKIVDPGKWPHVEMGRSDDIKPGSWCMALGHPGGVQQGRTPPIRLGRILAAGKRAKFLVSDATVISGDSGGPLFDLEGRVIGIHSNIGISVNQNQHVPIDVFRSQWNDLLASKTFGSPRDMQPASRIDPEKARRFQQLFFRRMMAGDADARALMKDGQLRVTPEDVDRLLAKWEKEDARTGHPRSGSAAAAAASAPVNAAGRPRSGSAANEPLDVLKFYRLFQDRLLEGDPETLKLIKNGKMPLTPSQMRQLMDQWEKKSLAADGSTPKSGEGAAKPPAGKALAEKGPAEKGPADKGPADKGPAEKAAGKVAGPSQPTPPPPPPRRRPPEIQQPVPPKAKLEDLAKLRDLMKSAQPLGDGRYGFSSPDATEVFRSLPGWDYAARAMSYGKSSPQLIKEIAPIAAQAGRSTAVVLCDGKPAALGTVVRKDGYILTKSSEVYGKVSCKIGGRELPATIVKRRREHDLVLVKVDAADLAPVAWAESDSPVLGSWLITPGPDNDVLGLGVVSIAAHTIPDAPTMLLRNRAVIGVMIDQAAKDALVQLVTPGLPADRGGVKAGDVIEKIDGQAIKGAKEVNQFLARYKPGDRIVVQVARKGKPLALKLDLVSSDRFAPKSTGERLTRLSEAGGTVSRRHASFVVAFTHDTVLQAADCGGPVVNLDGQAIGLNIARVDRTATYAIPAKMLRMLLPEMLPK